MIPGEVDPATGQLYAGPEENARLRAGDVLLVDEAGMLDQDTARALLVVADECRVGMALLGDRRQLAAVGRGVLDLAAGRVDPAAHVTLDEVHRFTCTDDARQTVPDTEYADLTLAMRAGEDPGGMFNSLVARGRIRLHDDPVELREALAAVTARRQREGERVAVVVDTREQAAELGAAIRERLVADGRVDDTRVAVTGAGQRIGAGDRIATRRNDRRLGVANRDIWTVTAVDRHGDLAVVPADVTPTGAVPAGVTPRRGGGAGAARRLRHRPRRAGLRQHRARGAGRHRHLGTCGDRRTHRRRVGLRRHDPRPHREHRAPGGRRPGRGAAAVDPVERRCLDRRAILQQLRETLRAVAALRAAHAAQHAHERAQQAEAGRRRDQQLSRIGALGRPPGPAGRLADVDRGIAAAEHELAGARAHIARLLADPALFGQPPGRLAAAHEDWRTRRAAYRHQPRTAPPRTAAAHPGVPRPESERRGPSLTRGGAVPGLGR